MVAVFITELDGRIVIQWPAVATGSYAALSAPITLNGELVGKLHLCGEVNSTIAFRLAADAQLLSNIVQLEYELESMTTDIIDQQDQLMALHQLAQTTRVYNDVRKTLGDLAKITSQLLKTEAAFMVLQTEGKAPLPVLYPPKDWPQDMWCKLVNELEQISDKRQWLLQQQDEPLRRLAVPIRNLLLKKMMVRPGIALILGAANKIVGEFQAPDLKLFSTIAEPAGANLENAILHQEILDQTRIQTEMELAKQVQMRLLPQRTPQLPGLELAAQSRSAFQVGGDFYDFIDSHGHLLTFTLCDVSGKCMPAALLISMLHTVL
jgi:sigma-B regulation protein RsbU (phosphoserine phosphatase)